MACVPTVRVEVESVAMPLLRVLVPSDVPPSKNCTEPVAVEDETVAVKVTVCPLFEGLRLDASVVVVPAVFTVWASGKDVLPLWLALPPYTAVIEWAPPARLEMGKVATPLASSDDEPRVVLPSLKVTLPAGVPAKDATVAVKVTDCP